MELKDVFLGSPNLGLAAVFESISQVARCVAGIATDHNPYAGRARACAKHLSALFRGDRAKLSSAFYAVLREAWTLQLAAVSLRENVPGLRFPSLAELESAADLHRRAQDDADGFDAGIGAFATLLNGAEFVRIDWAGPSQSGLRLLLEPIFQAVKDTGLTFHFCGSPGVWRELYRIARGTGLGKLEAYELLNSWSIEGKIQADVATGSQFVEAKVELSDKTIVGFLVFPESDRFARLFRVPEGFERRLRNGRITRFEYKWNPYDELRYVDHATGEVYRPDDPRYPD